MVYLLQSSQPSHIPYSPNRQHDNSNTQGQRQLQDKIQQPSNQRQEQEYSRSYTGQCSPAGNDTRENVDKESIGENVMYERIGMSAVYLLNK